MRYDAFISYSHAADAQLAPRLQDALQRLAKPWWRRRSLEVFRDFTGLTANPGLWSSIITAMDDSAWFVFLASPEAAASPWVDKELQHWLEHHSVDRLLPVLTEGEWVWDATTDGFDMSATTAVPPALVHAFGEEPRHVDLRWARTEEHLDLRHSRFRDQVAEIAAPIHGLAKDELEGEDIRQHRRTRRWAAATVIALSLLTTASVVASVFAVSNANNAEEARTDAVSSAAEAEANADEARTNAALALERGEDADLQRDRAESSAEEADERAEEAAYEAARAEENQRLADSNAFEAQANALEADDAAEQADASAADARSSALKADQSAADASANEAEARAAEANARAAEAEAEAARADAVDQRDVARIAALRADQARAAQSVSEQAALRNESEAVAARARTEIALDAERTARSGLLARSLASASMTQADLNGPLSLLLAARSMSSGLSAAAAAADAGQRTAASRTPPGSVGQQALTAAVLSLEGGLRAHPIDRFLSFPARLERPGSLSAPAFSRNGRTVAAADLSSNRVVLWNLDDPGNERLITSAGNGVYGLEFAADDELLFGLEYGVSNQTIWRAWDAGTGEQVLAGTGFVEVSPDGRHVAILSEFSDGVLQFYDTVHRRFTATYSGVSVGTFDSELFSADGRWVTADVAGTAAVWDMSTGGTTQIQLAPPDGSSSHPQVAPDGRTAAVVLGGGAALGVYALPEAQLLDTIAFPTPLGPVGLGEWSDDGSKFVLEDMDGEMRIVDLATRSVLSPSQFVGQSLPVAFSADGQFVTAQSLWRGTTTLISTADGSVTDLGADLLALGGPSGRLAFLERIDSTFAATDLDTGVTSVADSSDTELVASAVSDDNRWLAVLASDRSVRVWDLVSGTGPTLGAAAPLTMSLTFSPSGTHLVGSGADLAVWDLSRVGGARPVGSLVAQISAVSPDGRTVFESPDGSEVVARDLVTGSVREVVGATLDRRVDTLLVSSDARTVAVSYDDATSFVIDGRTFEIRGQIDGRVLTFSGDGRRLSAVGVNPFPFAVPDEQEGVDPFAENVVSVVDAQDLSTIGTVDLGADRASGGPGTIGTAVALDQAGERIAAVNSTGAVGVWSVATAQPLWASRPEPADNLVIPTRSLAFSPDGRVLAVRSSPERIRLLDAGAGNLQATQILGLTTYRNYTTGGLAWSQDGSVLAADGVHVLDGSTLELIGDLRLNIGFGSVFLRRGFVTFTLDGALLTPSGDGTQLLRIELGADALVATACDKAGRDLTAAEWDQYVGSSPQQAVCAQPQSTGPVGGRV